jgi:hypothetical protein
MVPTLHLGIVAPSPAITSSGDAAPAHLRVDAQRPQAPSWRHRRSVLRHRTARLHHNAVVVSRGDLGRPHARAVSSHEAAFVGEGCRHRGEAGGRTREGRGSMSSFRRVALADQRGG